METLVIDRARWYRGHGSPGSALLRPQDQLMCCLGFCLLQRGFEQQELVEVGTPQEVDRINAGELDAVARARGLVEWCDNEVNTYETSVCMKLIDVNDAEDLSGPVREAQITELFAEIGVKVEFIN